MFNLPIGVKEVAELLDLARRAVEASEKQAKHLEDIVLELRTIVDRTR